MITVAEALEKVLALVAPLPAESVELRQGLGRVLAAPVTARLVQRIAPQLGVWPALR